MEPRRTPRRPVAIAATLVALAFGASGCSGGLVGTPAAATVESSPDGGSTISTDISTNDLEALNEAYRQYYEQQAEKGDEQSAQFTSLLADFEGDGSTAGSTVSMPAAQQSLNDLINNALVEQELERRGASVTESDQDAAKASLQEQVGEEDWNKVPADLRDFTVRSSAALNVYRQELADEQTAALPEVDPADRELQLQELYQSILAERPLCLNIIFTDTEAEAADAKARIDGGEGFGEVAAETSLSQPTVESGGYAGCATLDEASTVFGLDLSGAGVDDVVGPTTYAASSAGEGAAPQFVVLQIESVTGPTYEQALPELEQAVPPVATAVTPEEVDVSIAIGELRMAADVSVDPRFGSWNEETGELDPPATLSVTTTTVAALLEGS